MVENCKYLRIDLQHAARYWPHYSKMCAFISALAHLESLSIVQYYGPPLVLKKIFQHANRLLLAISVDWGHIHLEDLSDFRHLRFLCFRLTEHRVHGPQSIFWEVQRRLPPSFGYLERLSLHVGPNDLAAILKFVPHLRSLDLTREVGPWLGEVMEVMDVLEASAGGLVNLRLVGLTECQVRGTAIYADVEDHVVHLDEVGAGWEFSRLENLSIECLAADAYFQRPEEPDSASTAADPDSYQSLEFEDWPPGLGSVLSAIKAPSLRRLGIGFNLCWWNRSTTDKVVRAHYVDERSLEIVSLSLSDRTRCAVDRARESANLELLEALQGQLPGLHAIHSNSSDDYLGRITEPIVSTISRV